MKKYLAIAAAIMLVFATVVFAQTISKWYYGISTPYIYPMTASTQAVSSYYLATPTLTGNDTFTGLTTTQTLTNKTLTTPVIASFYQDAAKTKLMTVPNTASDTLAAIAATQTLTNKTLTAPVINFGATSHSYLGGTDAYNVSGASLGYVYFYLTSAGGAVSMFPPDAAGHLIVVHNTTGQTVTVKTSSGTGAASVASTKKAIFVHNGTDYVNALGDQ